MHVQIVTCHLCSLVAFLFSLLFSLLVVWQIFFMIGEKGLKWLLPDGGVKIKTIWKQQENLQETRAGAMTETAECLAYFHTTSKSINQSIKQTNEKKQSQ